MEATLEGSALYRRILAYDYRSEERRRLMADVWRSTPWVISVYTGSWRSGDEEGIMHWCRETFGAEHSFIHGVDGSWQRGGATVHGWTWIGFRTEEMLARFRERFSHVDMRMETT